MADAAQGAACNEDDGCHGRNKPSKFNDAIIGGAQFSVTRGKRDITPVTDSVTNLDPFVNY